MNYKTFLTLSLFFAFFSSLTAEATHMMGGEITYKRISSLKYEVSLIWYRDCRGIALTNAGQINIKCSTGGSINDTLTLITIEDITPYCHTVSGKCNPTNTTGTGGGIEKHTFKGIVDFNATSSSLAGCSGKIIISSAINSRNGAITTGSANTTLYIDTELDLANAPNNSSPIIVAPALGYLCCNQPFYYTFNAIDTLDYDSLTYSFIAPRSSRNTTTPYSSTFSYTSPFTVYDPRIPPQPYNPNPNASPPIGLYLDPATGEVIFTPVNCSEVTVMVLQVTEWRKDSTGTPKIIGKTLRDMQYNVGTCPDNNPPSIDGPYTYNVCEGDQICFNITTDDVAFSSPGSTPPPDSTKLSWNGGIPGASFNILNDTVLHQTGRFCWTAPVGSVKNIPYTFVATVRDNACPLNAITARTFRIAVKKRATSSRTITPINPDLYHLKSQIDSTFVGTPSYTSAILNGTGQIVLDTLAARFVSSNLYFSNNQIDTLRLKRNGQFIIESTINNAPNNCPSTYYDTIRVDSVLQTLINYPKDTLVCAGTSALLSTATVFAQGTPSYQWYKNDTMVLTGETSASYTVQNIPQLADVTYTIQVTDDSGRVNRDRIRIRSKDNYDNSFAKKYEACLGDSIVLELDTVFINRLWHDNATDSVRVYHQSATTWVTYQDSFQCVYNDTMDVIIHALPKPKLRDSSTCESAMTLMAGTFAAYQWSAGSSFQSQAYTATTSNTYWVEVTDSNGCKNSDTASIFIWNAALVDLGNDSSQCGGTIALVNTLASAQVWSTGDTSAVLVVDSSGEYSIITTDSNGCQSFDTVSIEIYIVPSQSWPDTLTFCSDSGALISSQLYAEYLWNTGDTTQSIFVSSNGFYALYFEDNQGCSSTDSVYVRLHNLPNLNLGNDTAFCGDSLLLALAPGNSYTWSTGDTLSFTSINASGDYWVQLTDSNECSVTDTVNITLLTNTNVPLLTKAGNVITSNLGGMHQWFMNENMINGQSDSFITISSIGSYTAVSIDSNNCISDTSNTITKTAGVDRLSSSSLTIYPNPTNGKVTIDAAGLGTINCVELYDNLGKQVANTQSINGSLIDLAWETRSGVLWVVVATNSGVFRQAVVSER